MTCVADGADLVRAVLAAPVGPAGKVHVLVVDEVMPHKSGSVAIAELNRLGVFVPFIVLSGAGDALLVTRALRSGAHRVLRKPVDLQELVAIVRSVSR